MNATTALHVDLDGAWPATALPDARHLDRREWGPPLRYSTTSALVRDFYENMQSELRPFTLYGSGDFHYLTALWLRRVEEPFTLVSFDNHPDWDIRPPHWCCGTWINRALELPHLREVAIWGCGNFELNWPSRLFANRRAMRENRLSIWPWSERISRSAREIWPGIQRMHWQRQFARFAQRLMGAKVYVTVDLDCLSGSATNWENGLFTNEDIAWALRELHTHTEVIGGDVCGAWSPVVYARFKQRIGGKLDHPRLPAVDPAVAKVRNAKALEMIWPALTSPRF